MREWLARLGDWFRRGRLDRELTEELRFHREQLEREARAAGAGVDEAPYAAGRRLGNATRHQEEARDRWSWPWLDHRCREGQQSVPPLETVDRRRRSGSAG